MIIELFRGAFVNIIGIKDFSWCAIIKQGVTRGYWGLQGVTRGYRGLKGVTGADKWLQRIIETFS